MANTLYLRELDNALALGRHQEIKEFNQDVYKYLGIKGFLTKMLDVFFPLMRCLIVVYALLYVFNKYLFSEMILLFKKSSTHKFENEKLFLFFLPLFYMRCKSADLFDESIYWISGGIVDPKKYDLSGKTLISYKSVLNGRDYNNILNQSLSAIKEYIEKYDCYYPIYKVWNYYETFQGLSKLSKDNDIYFSNQSDRWAIMFDAIPSRTKTLIQHGIASHTIVCPAQLSHIDVLYAISRQTSDDMYFSILNCKPELRFVKPTLTLTEIPKRKKSILLVSHILYLDFEKQILNLLSRKGLDIYLKKHPEVKNDSCYLELKEKYGYHYITDSTFPKVDAVISYQSTLAYEYMMYDIPTFIYDQSKELDTDEVKHFIESV